MKLLGIFRVGFVVNFLLIVFPATTSIILIRQYDLIQVENYNFISPQVSLSGNTSIGSHNMFGVNSATIPGVTIGNNNTIGAGSIITRNVAHNAIVVGVPGKKIKTKEI